MLNRMYGVEGFARYDKLALWALLDDEWSIDAFF